MQIQVQKVSLMRRGAVRNRAAGEAHAVPAESRVLGHTARRANAGPHARALATTAQRAAARPGGLPDGLRAGMERLSGRDLSGVRVHYGSPKPAQLEAHAYAQGRDIHLARRQERHLPHEAWHVVQQMQGRVRPTMQLRGTGINDDAGLEREATVMGDRALAEGKAAQLRARPARPAVDGVRPVQRVVDLDEYLGDEDRERLFGSELSVDDLEEIQELLRDREAVSGLLQELEGETEAQFWTKGSEFKYTRALNMALSAQERKWMNTRGSKDRELIGGSEGQLDNDTFLGRVGSMKPLKDVGAAISHGEYAHRLQWYMISRSLEKNLFARDEDDESGRFSEKHPRAGEFRHILSQLYQHMADPEYTKVFRGGRLDVPTGIEDRNKVSEEQSPLPLWSAILDIQGSHVDRGLKGEGGFTRFGDVFAAAPVKLTGALTYETDPTTRKVGEGGLQRGGLAYSQVSLAVLNRRLKRWIGKGRKDDLTLKKAVDSLITGDEHVKELLDGSGKRALDYDDRNEIAFKLLGIPW
jgi:hypothetical protein